VEAHGLRWDRLSAFFPGRNESELQRRWAVLSFQADRLSHDSELPQISPIPPVPPVPPVPDSIIDPAQDHGASQVDAGCEAGFQFDDEFWDQVRRDNAIDWFA
jgi:hypothetical protein